MLVLIYTRPNGGLTTTAIGLVTMKTFPPTFLNVFSEDSLFLPIITYFQFNRNSCQKLGFSPIFLK